MTFPHQNEDPVGETEEISEEEAAYEAAEKSSEKRDHAVGGSRGTTDGQ